LKKYKEIKLKLNDPLSATDREVLTRFISRLPDNGVKITEKTDHISIKLDEVDINILRELNKALSNEFGLDYESNVIGEIINKIDSIKSYGIKSGKRVYVGFNEERKVRKRKAKEKKRGGYYYAKDNGFSKINNECPPEYNNKIISADSDNILKELPDNCIDLVLTSPPYNFGLDYEESEDDHFWESYFAKLFNIFGECIRVTKFGGRIIINVQPLFSDYIPTHHIISDFFIKNKLIWKAEILWEKHNYNCKYTAWGSWKSPSNPYFKYTWEFVEVFCKGDLRKDGDSDNIDISGDEFKKWVYAKWAIAPERNMKEFGHPAMFPEELVDRVLKVFSYQNDIILDPFNGVGTTTFVAHRLGRKYLGIDISEEYCETARKRIESRLF
jgi:DNA modification methylase